MRLSRITPLSLLLCFGSPDVRAAASAGLDSRPGFRSVPSAASDTAGLLRTVARAREALAGLPALWQIDGSEVAWVFVGDGEAWATRRQAGRDSLVAIALPPGTMVANTSVAVDGHRWAMIVLPLGTADDARVRLLLHEAMHTFQPERLPNPGATEPGDGGELLDTEAGRTWLFLELRALVAALSSSGDARHQAARDALRFRAQRDSLARPKERNRLDALDLTEGIPEYTAWRLSRSPTDSLVALLRRAPERPGSWVRSVGYSTGPAYGFLLDTLAADWRDAQRQGMRLPTILSTVLGSMPDTQELAARARHYGSDGIQRAEAARATARVRRLDSLRTLFVTSPALRVLPGALQISFDPSGQLPVGTDGTVMTGLRWAASDGAELVAPWGAFVSPDWNWVQVPLGRVKLEAGILREPRVVEGDGWKLTLPAGWRVTHSGSLVEVRPPS